MSAKTDPATALHDCEELESMWMIEVAELLRERPGKAAEKVSMDVWPDEQVRIAGETNRQLRGGVPLLNYDMNSTGRKAERLLGWAPRSQEEAITAFAESLIRHGLLCDERGEKN